MKGRFEELGQGGTQRLLAHVAGLAGADVAGLVLLLGDLAPRSRRVAVISEHHGLTPVRDGSPS